MLTPLGVVNLSVINLSSPTLRAWGLVSATFLEAPARFQPCRPLEPLESGFSQAGAKEPQDERGGTPPDGVPGSLLDQCSDSLEGQAPTGLTEGRTNSLGMATG